mgnify:CR=1 FL=1
MYRVYLFVIGICICCPLIGAKEPLHLLADPTPTVTLDMKRVSLQDILLEIEKQTGLFFSYESSMLKEFRYVSLTARDESLSYCLVRAFTSCLPDYGTLCDIETETPAIYHQWVCAGFRILRESDCGNRGGAFFRKRIGFQ